LIDRLLLLLLISGGGVLQARGRPCYGSLDPRQTVRDKDDLLRQLLDQLHPVQLGRC